MKYALPLSCGTCLVWVEELLSGRKELRGFRVFQGRLDAVEKVGQGDDKGNAGQGQGSVERGEGNVFSA